MGIGLSKNATIEIQDNFIKIPYKRYNKTYYMLIPLDKDEIVMNRIKSLINNEVDIKEDIHINHIIECKLKTKGKKEIDVTNCLESYMGPDQFYKKNKNLIRIRDILPIKYHDSFSYIKTLNEDMEYKTYLSIDDLLFNEEGCD